MLKNMLCKGHHVNTKVNKAKTRHQVKRDTFANLLIYTLYSQKRDKLSIQQYNYYEDISINTIL